MIQHIYELEKLEEFKKDYDIYLVDEWFKDSCNTNVKPMHPRTDFRNTIFWHRTRSNPVRKNYH